MSGKFLLDTNIIIGIFVGDEKILSHLKSNPEIFIPSIVIGELFYGAQLSMQAKSNTNRIEKLAENCTILNCELETSKVYARVKAGLKNKGRPIPENDIWIASIAIQHKIRLITRDSHFDFVEGLNKEKW